MLEQPSVWLAIIAFVAAIGPLVFFHELGHYGVARLFGVKAEAFSIGFGREIAGWTDKRGTRWKVGWLPLGGYVRFAGDMDAASRPAHGDGDPDHFQNRPVWQRFLIVLAGPVSNFLLAILIFAALFMTLGTLQSSNVVGEVVPDSAAARMDLRPGDEILSIEGQGTEQFSDVARIVSLRPDENVELVIKRDERQITLKGQLGAIEEEDRFGQKVRLGLLGVASAEARFDRAGPVTALGLATNQTVGLTRSIVDGLGQIITGKRSIRELGGPLKIAQISGQAWVLGLYSFIFLVALLSINLGFINLLPIPMLDGGHLALYTIEAARRRPLSEAAQERAFRGGLAFLLIFVLFVTLNDTVSIGLFDRLQRLIG
ncbi:RIP metalloprotease RseP [Sphingomicrobium lutaoense]|uniref:Zinc metalloprotease n=1 Tax=Sphingomicrobium lutaoense TaxID=515949 RepID=A0A839YX98_9SPHN|nr:RIP metalloprotease RseP [Sphingomicrobium lutaoense]MBB3763809.1 regulator of sigma E protease [Sphingomicrobium lutaoense]